MEIIPTGINHVTFTNNSDHYTWTKARTDAEFIFRAVLLPWHNLSSYC